MASTTIANVITIITVPLANITMITITILQVSTRAKMTDMTTIVIGSLSPYWLSSSSSSNNLEEMVCRADMTESGISTARKTAMTTINIIVVEFASL